MAHSYADTQQFLGSPSLVRLPGGDLLASHDLFGPGSSSDTVRIYASIDDGASWRRRAEIKGGFWSSLFVHRDELYLIGTSRQDGYIVIRRSKDGGRSWTEPKDDQTGLLRADGRYHTAPMPVVEFQGRLWRSFEDAMGAGGWGSYFNTFVMSASSGANLLVATNWTFSNRLPRNPQWLGGKFGGWLEGNVVIAPGERLVNILRADFREPDEKAAVVGVSLDGKTVEFDPESGFIDFPGGCKKFAIRRDPLDFTYWSLANWIPPSQQGGNVERTRNTLALLHSEDLRHWEVRCVLLHHPDRDRHAFQYADFMIEGDEILALVRTAFDDYGGGAVRGHDANYITFHRWAGFRDRTINDSVPVLGLRLWRDRDGQPAPKPFPGTEPVRPADPGR